MRLIIVYVVIGLLVGSVSGALGIGGGVLLVPALMWLCRFEPARAAGTSLAILIPPIGLPAAMKAYSEKRVDLEVMFGTLMIYVGIRFLVGAPSETRYAWTALISIMLAWLGHLVLRALGRRHMAPPTLGQEIRSMQEKGYGEMDYHI